MPNQRFDKGDDIGGDFLERWAEEHARRKGYKWELGVPPAITFQLKGGKRKSPERGAARYDWGPFSWEHPEERTVPKLIERLASEPGLREFPIFGKYLPAWYSGRTISGFVAPEVGPFARLNRALGDLLNMFRRDRRSVMSERR